MPETILATVSLMILNKNPILPQLIFRVRTDTKKILSFRCHSLYSE